jgi:cell division septal protein FtsQ
MLANNYHKLNNFSNKKNKYSNPFFKNKRGGVFSEKKLRLTFKIRLILIFSLIFLIIFVWFVLLSSFFVIKDINITGLTRTSSDDINNIIHEQMSENSGLVFKQNNIILFSQKEFLDNLNSKYNFETIDFKKHYLDRQIKLKIIERGYALVWSEDDHYYYADNNGNIINEANPLDITSKDYPIIYNESDKKIDQNKIFINEDALNFVFDLFDKLKNNTYNIDMEKFIINNETNSLKLKVVAGPEVMFNIKDTVDGQIEKLILIKDNQLKNTFSSQEYVDLRFGDRIYYR